MTLRLWHRLFLAIALPSAAAMAAFALLQAHSFQQGFLEYVNRLERERLEVVSQALVGAYARHGDWRFLEGDARRMHVLLQIGADDANGRPPPPPARREPMRPPFERDRRDGPFDPEMRGPPGIPHPPRNAAALPSRVLLVDADDAIVAGNPTVPRDAPAIELRHDGRLVGHLLVAPLPRLRSNMDLDFARSQHRTLAIVGVSLLIVAVLAAWWLSRWLLRPVRALAAGAQALANGDYAARIDIRRGDELGALADDFNALATALERHRDARRRWGADIAHELRTPISILSGEIQALQDGIRNVDAARLASLQAECARLRDLVDDLYDLSLSDAEALSYRFEPLDFGALVTEALRAHEDALRAAGIVCEATLPPYPIARGDRARLRQLLDNVLANVARYTDAPGRVVVALESIDHEAGDARCRLRIDDTAPGVPAEALPRLFDRLYRVEPSRSRQFGGAGLGLAICRNIVEAHGGRIDAHASPLGGLRIDIELPRGVVA